MSIDRLAEVCQHQATMFRLFIDGLTRIEHLARLIESGTPKQAKAAAVDLIAQTRAAREQLGPYLSHLETVQQQITDAKAMWARLQAAGLSFDETVAH